MAYIDKNIACDLLAKKALEEQQVDECAELTFRISTESVGSRGNVTDYPSNPGSWSQAERAVDGRYLYNLSVYLSNI